ncbi:SDR family oxidoreductase [Streptomyces sp. 135]|uniref:SDR family oxidoreductase n=1 Tax=Streptomyces sp. 135 TaxID=2838850 RepID=UPI0023EF4488|nr:SDR family oxidoreductase [Streptomyces sp. 135]
MHANAAPSDLLMRHAPLARWADPEEVAAPAVFLTSPAASFITGHTLVIDGGLTVSHGGLADVPAPQAMAAAAASSGSAT